VSSTAVPPSTVAGPRAGSVDSPYARSGPPSGSGGWTQALHACQAASKRSSDRSWRCSKTKSRYANPNHRSTLALRARPLGHDEADAQAGHVVYDVGPTPPAGGVELAPPITQDCLGQGRTAREPGSNRRRRCPCAGSGTNPRLREGASGHPGQESGRASPRGGISPGPGCRSATGHWSAGPRSAESA